MDKDIFNNSKLEMEKFDVIIIGGGAAGIMAAITVKKEYPQRSVLIIEQTFALGRKILVSGAGRCNLTNKSLAAGQWLQHYYADSPQILNAVFQQFSYLDILSFFTDLGVITYEEAKNNSGKIFPITDSAKNVVTLLQDELERMGVLVKLEYSCTSVKKRAQLFEVQVFHGNSTSLLTSEYLIMATGGKTYPALGANGSGYNILQALGHALAEPVPAAGPLLSKDNLCQALQGVKVNVSGSISIAGEKCKKSIDDIIFTQYGVSGSLIFNLSRDVSIYFNRSEQQPEMSEVMLEVNFVPQLSPRELEEYLTKQWQKRPGQLLQHSLLGIMNVKIATALCKRIDLNPERQVKDVSALARKKLLDCLHSTKIKISGTRSWNEAEFTAGGVRTTELDPKTLQSMIVPKLYCCGEVINVDGDIGGFNLSWAWASGNVAGKLQD